MSCYIKTIGLVACYCLLLVGSAFAQADSVEVVVQKDPVPVEIHSSGNSRFEFEGDNIVVAYWGGVEIEYFGYLIQAEDLRYNKVQQQGVLEGNVVITSEGLSLRCAKVVLDAAAGQLTIHGPITGTIPDPMLVFSAGQARLTFAPGEMVDSLGDITMELAGSVSLETQAGMQFVSSGFTFNGATAELACSGPFTLTAASLAMPGDGGNTGTGITNLEVTGESLVGLLNPDGLLQSAEIRLLEITSREVFLEADLATVSASPTVDGTAAWDLSVTGKPLMGGVYQERHDIAFSANSAKLAIGQHGLETLVLVGGIDVELEDSTLHADRVNIERTTDGYQLAFPGNLVVKFDLFEMSGGDLAGGGAIEQWLGS